MTNKEILKRVMKKYYVDAKEINIIECDFGFRVDVYTNDLGFPTISLPYQCIIFSHDFADTFFPYHRDNLQRMVILSDSERLKYLKKFL